MSKNKIAARIDSQSVEVKTKFDAEFRRFSLNRTEKLKYEDFKGLIEKLHRLHDVAFLISYTDPRDGDLLPINNDDNLARALLTARPLLRVIIQRKGDSLEELNGYGTMRPRNIISSILSGTPAKNKGLAISNPHDFRMVSAIIDVDIVPETCRRVKLLKHGFDRPLGFFIRDGTSVRVTPNGVERSPGIFISRLVPGGLAESTGLLGVNDEVLEVNGIDVSNKTLDQVTDMMVANSSNLIITVRPANQRAGPPPPDPRDPRASQPPSETDEDRFDQDDHDEIVDLTAVTLEDQPEPHFPHSITSKDDGQILHL
ncbi:partitioning defective protein 6 [Pararge aegeria]|uniref:Jg21749 protein n=1 Tax=Pararge aegeria aegeria TaxID=348720 RepID=A0A8S4S7S1_9NEOP|nr:partitioning defective protein 6 [Pararge aegeria]CAH2249214.1 jg21749 [Pararge aegeria aegeria]